MIFPTLPTPPIMTGNWGTMCDDCWADWATIPLEWHDDIPLARVLIEMLYAEHLTGGPLHAFLDDWNIEEDPEPWKIEEFPPAVRGLVLAIVEVMTPMTARQRAEVLRNPDYAEGAS